MSDEVSAQDRGFLYGDGLFETVRVEGRPRFLAHHQRRFEQSAQWLKFPASAVEAGLEALDQLSGRRDGLWRVTVTRPGDRVFGGGTGTVKCRHRPLPDKSSPISATVVEDSYVPQDRIAEHKTTSWIRSVLARKEAEQRGFDEALMVSRSGRVGEASAANVFLRIAGGWVTPRVEGILPGVVRSVVIEEAKKEGFVVDERPVLTADLTTCEAMALTSAGRLVTPVAALDGMKLEVELVEELTRLVR